MKKHLESGFLLGALMLYIFVSYIITRVVLSTHSFFYLSHNSFNFRCRIKLFEEYQKIKINERLRKVKMSGTL